VGVAGEGHDFVKLSQFIADLSGPQGFVVSIVEAVLLTFTCEAVFEALFP
jgi:hypothetical protein